MDRRGFLLGTAGAAAAATIARPGFAQDNYPARAITIINPFPPGGATDVVTRPFAAALEPIVKQPVVIDTKAGAAGSVGAQVASVAKPDGYTLLSHLPSLAGFAEVDRLFGRPPKFTTADFIPIARLIADPCVLIVNDQQPYKNLKEFIDDATKRPNEILFSSSGLYGALHIPMALFTNAANLKLRHLPTPGGGPALTALIGNNVQALASSVSACLAQIKAGKARPLALFGRQRSKALPDVPTMKEAGFDVEYYLWVGKFAPKGTPEPVIAYLRGAFQKAAQSDQFKAALTNLGQELDYLDQPEFSKFWDTDGQRIQATIRQIGKIEG
ncbi:MAG TPA: tripartite tricarboxylate transporter substrate binding protein [Xanthobacteraceae bacterium]|jgi:tripartite-type tricarboxylate transporter receptor subunit TctC|nr:tripartite tricarboxylate transporter substrate binding protein [Xanthobacteraceae bacterium]